LEKKIRARRILEALKSRFTVPNLSKITDDPFKILVRTIISQTTAEANTRRAYRNLSRKMELTPESLAGADAKEIEEALFVAGLYRNKSRIIKKVSELIIQEFDGSLDFIYSKPLKEAREKLLGLPGVGPKTADIILLFCAKRPVLPIDTHVNRVSKRLGLVPQEADYEEIREELEALFRPEEYFDVHMLFITLGRRICNARKPRHAECPVNHLCPSAHI
jgi:endonuclease-3